MTPYLLKLIILVIKFDSHGKIVSINKFVFTKINLIIV